MLQELESWFSEGLTFVEHDILPVATLALDFIPGVPAVVPAIIGRMPELIATAEKMFPGDGKGPIKQEYFMKTAELAARDMGELSTGGQADTWKNDIQPKIDPLLSLVIAGINKFKPGAIDTSSDENAKLSAGTPG
jgi:hypothetical protein